MASRKPEPRGGLHVQAARNSPLDKRGKPLNWVIRFVYKLANGESKQHYETLYNTSKSQAQKEATVRRNALQDPDAPKRDELTFSEFVALPRFETHYLDTLGEEYRFKVERAIEVKLIPTFGKLRLSQITARRLEDYLVELRKTCEPKAQAQNLHYITHALRLAHKWGLLATVPDYPKVKVPKDAKLPNRLNAEQLDKLLTFARDHEEYTLLLFATDSLVRGSEQLALSWRHLDLREGLFRLEGSFAFGKVAPENYKLPKEEKVSVLPMSDRARDALTKLKAERQAKAIPCHPDDLVFGSYIPSRGALYKRVRRACKRAGVPHTSRHGLRHTGASLLISRRVPEAVVQAMLTHSTSAMTRRYAQLEAHALNEVRTVFDGLATTRKSEEAPRPSGPKKVISSPRRQRPTRVDDVQRRDGEAVKDDELSDSD